MPRRGPQPLGRGQEVIRQFKYSVFVHADLIDVRLVISVSAITFADSEH